LRPERIPLLDIVAELVFLVEGLQLFLYGSVGRYWIAACLEGLKRINLALVKIFLKKEGSSLVK
jgi:hypothetical protein